MIKQLHRAISFLISGVFAISTSASSAVAPEISQVKNQVPVHQMVIPERTMVELDNTPRASLIEYSFGGFDYQSTYIGKDCSSGICQYYSDNIVLIGPSNPNATNKPNELTIIRTNPPGSVSSSIGTNAGTSQGSTPSTNDTKRNSTAGGISNLGVGSQDSHGSGTSTGAEAGKGTGTGSGSHSGKNSGQNGGKNKNGSNGGNGRNNSNGKEPGFGDGFGDSLAKGLESGLSAGLGKAFQDYVIFTPGSQKELEKSQQDFQAADTKAAKAYNDLVLENAYAEKEIEVKLNKLQKNLDALKTSSDSFERYLENLKSNDSPKPNELARTIEDALRQPTVRPSFKKSVNDTLQRFEKAPEAYSETQRDFKNIAASALSAATQSELLLEHEVAAINLEMARTSLDVLYGLDPYTGIHRDLFELMTGKNIITGEDLSDFERALSGVGVAGAFVTGGISSSFSNGLKATYRALNNGVKNSNSIMRAMKITEQSRSIVNTLKDLRIPIQSGISKLTSTLKKQAKRIGDISLQNTKQTTEQLVRDGLQTGKVNSLPPLSPKALRNPHSPESLARIREVVGDGIRIADKNILPGSNGKVSLIGRPMNVVKEQALRLQKEGFDVELFDTDWMKKLGRPSPISKDAASGYEKTIDKIIKGDVSDPYNALKDLPLYAENKKWIQQKIGDGNTIIDIGDNSGNRFRSPFYDIEIEIFENTRSHK